MKGLVSSNKLYTTVVFSKIGKSFRHTISEVQHLFSADQQPDLGLKKKKCIATPLIPHFLLHIGIQLVEITLQHFFFFVKQKCGNMPELSWYGS